MECLSGIFEEDVLDCSNYQIFVRGQEYMVEDFLHKIANNTVVTTVKGTREYRIEFYMEEGGIYSTCECPYNDVCKHTVAALLLIVHYFSTSRSIR